MTAIVDLRKECREDNVTKEMIIKQFQDLVHKTEPKILEVMHHQESFDDNLSNLVVATIRTEKFKLLHKFRIGHCYNNVLEQALDQLVKTKIMSYDLRDGAFYCMGGKNYILKSP